MRDDKKQPTLQDVATVHNQQLLEGARNTIRELHTEVVVNRVNAVLPEAVFVEYFLDFFMYPSKYQNSPLLSKWVELAGGPYNPVDIISPTGAVLFTAPGAMINVAINYDVMNNINFSAVASVYNMKKKITTAQATNYIASVLGTVDKNIHADTEAHIMKWAIIFDRYAAKPAIAKQAPKTPVDAPDLGIFDL